MMVLVYEMPTAHMSFFLHLESQQKQYEDQHYSSLVSNREKLRGNEFYAIDGRKILIIICANVKHISK